MLVKLTMSFPEYPQSSAARARVLLGSLPQRSSSITGVVVVVVVWQARALSQASVEVVELQVPLAWLPVVTAHLSAWPICADATAPLVKGVWPLHEVEEQGVRSVASLLPLRRASPCLFLQQQSAVDD